MKYSEAIRRADALRPNAVDDEEKRAWLAALDGRIAVDVMLMDITEAQQFAGGEDREGLVRFPHDELYVSYLLARIDEANGEYDRYANSARVFNERLNSYSRWFAQTWEPANGYTGR